MTPFERIGGAVDQFYVRAPGDAQLRAILREDGYGAPEEAPVCISQPGPGRSTRIGRLYM
jgi:hypothetical protein